MKLVVGLGNPGTQYENTRHNVGFYFCDQFVKETRAQPFKQSKKNLLSELMIHGTKCFVIKPQTFMNRSGEAVTEVAQFYKIGAESILVIHDELDLDFGRIQLKVGGGSAGHNGIRSLETFLGPSCDQITRIRIGIGKPAKDTIPIEDYVLQKFKSHELKEIENLAPSINDAVSLWIGNDLAKAMSLYNRRNTP